MRKKPELLAPAGDMEKLRMAVLYGADAVYLAGTSFGMRSFAGNFTADELPEAVRFAHDHGVRVHVTVNTMPRNDEVARLPEHLERLNDLGVDALILADLGAFTLAGRYAPRCERHISTQQSIANYECARAWYDLGAKRVVLAREVSLQEIREMRAKLPPPRQVTAASRRSGRAGTSKPRSRASASASRTASMTSAVETGWPSCRRKRAIPVR